MTEWRLLLVVSCFFAAAGLAVSGTKGPPLIVDLHARRAQIRTALLQHTSLGSNVTEVMDFVSRQLQSKDGAAQVTVEPVKGDSQSQAAKTIRVYLGQYYDHPEVVFFSAPLLMQKEVTAEWLFDSHDRLIEIVVEKKDELY